MSQTISPQISQPFYGYVNGNQIFSSSWDGGQQQVGVTMPAHNDLLKQYGELTAICESYKARLVELKEIEVPMTQEEIIQQQAAQIADAQQQLADSRAIMRQFADKLDELMNQKGTVYEPVQYDGLNSRTEQGDAGEDAPGVSGGTVNKANKGRAVGIPRKK